MIDSKNIFSFSLSAESADKLYNWGLDRGWNQASSQPYVLWRLSGPHVILIYYQSGKLVVQGKGASEFVEEVLEPNYLQFSVTLSCDNDLTSTPYKAHAGMDESGKGDFFGPLVVVAAYVDENSDKALKKIGIRDCKTLSDSKIRQLYRPALEIIHHHCSIIAIGPQAYNQMYESFKNLNRLLAWGHAKALETLLEKVPACTMAIADQFAHPSLIQNALQEKGRAIELIQRTKAESDMAVATASVIARAEFLFRLEKLSMQAGESLPKGAGTAVLEAGKKMIQKYGTAEMKNFCKIHFSTFQNIQQL